MTGRILVTTFLCLLMIQSGFQLMRVIIKNKNWTFKNHSIEKISIKSKTLPRYSLPVRIGAGNQSFPQAQGLLDSRMINSIKLIRWIWTLTCLNCCSNNKVLVNTTRNMGREIFRIGWDRDRTKLKSVRLTIKMHQSFLIMLETLRKRKVIKAKRN